MSPPIKNVIIIGASGNIGQFIVSALISNGFSVSVLTRESSNTTFPANVMVHRTDYSMPSLLKAFENQDAVVSAIATLSTSQQALIIDAAVVSGVKRFIPSEYGIDTSVPEVVDAIPVIKGKRDTIALLREYESKGLSWTAVCVGAFFDWVLEIPGLMGWNVPARKAVIFDGGNYEFEATNVNQICRAVAAVLQPENFEDVKNRYVYVNSFTVTQNQVLASLEKITGERFKVEHAQVAELSRRSLRKMELPKGHGLEDDPVYDSLFGGEIVAAIFGHGGFNNFSKTRGLWNEKLGLPKEDVEATLIKVLRDMKASEN